MEWLFETIEVERLERLCGFVCCLFVAIISFCGIFKIVKIQWGRAEDDKSEG